MSLINQVLKDLEKRHAGANAGLPVRTVRPLPDERSRRGMWIGLALIVVAVLAAGGAWWWTKRNPDALPMAADKVPPPPQAAALAPIAPLPQPVTRKPDATTVAPTPPAAAGQASLHGLPTPQPAAGSQTSHLAPTDQSAAASVPAPMPPSNQASAAAAASTVPKAAPAATSAPGATGSPQPIKTAAAASAPVNKSADGATPTQPPRAPAPESATARANPARAKPRALPESPSQASTPVSSPEYPDPKEAQGDANIEKQVRPPSDRERAEASFRQGMRSVENGNVAEAESSLREALRLDPLADKARQALLSIYVADGRREDAERLLEDRLQPDPKQFGFAMALARLQLERGSNGDALITLQRSLPYGENNADYQAMLANALSRVSRHKEAAERYSAASRLAPRNPLWQMGLGVELRSDNRNAEARAAFQRARELGGLNAQLTAFLDQQLRELQ